MRPLDLIRGFPGKPLHPPLTDVSIGSYTAGTVMLVLGTLGVEKEQMAHGGLLAISVGLLVATPTALTGLIDWLGIEQGTPAKRVATVHLITMVCATLVFAGAWLAQLDGYKHDVVKSAGWILAAGGELLLLAGGYLGGTMVFVYGVRVLKRRDTPIRDALIPKASSDPEVAYSTDERTGPTTHGR